LIVASFGTRRPPFGTFGVGQNPDAVSLVGSPGVARSHNSPLCREPHRGKVKQDQSKSSSHKHRAVFHPHESGLNFTNNACHLAPESRTGAADPGALAGGGDVLARESARHHVNNASPRSTVKGSHVIPDREGRKASVVLTGQKNIAGVGVELDGADGSPPEEMPPEDAATSACEKCQLIHVLLQIRNDQQEGGEYGWKPPDSHPQRWQSLQSSSER
jgi:hypothetical protein